MAMAKKCSCVALFFVLAGLVMALGTAIGLVAYTQIGFYVAALTSCLVSLAICLVGLALYDDEFNWERLQRMEK